MVADSFRVALFGATGFIGAAVHEELVASGIASIAVARQVPTTKVTPGTAFVSADLGIPSSLDPAVAGADVVIHAASYTGSDPALSDTVNRIGTENLIAAAARAGVRRLIYVSTVGVYGFGPHSGITEDQVDPVPVSAISVSRLAAENAVRSFGGTVVRVGFVYGPQDRWFLPGLVQMQTALGAWVENGDARLSVISIHDLGRLIATLASGPAEGEAAGEGEDEIFHAARPEPVTVRTLVETLAAQGKLELPTTNLTWSQALNLGAQRGLSERHIDLLGRDHYYDATRIWNRTGLTPGVHGTAFP